MSKKETDNTRHNMQELKDLEKMYKQLYTIAKAVGNVAVGDKIMTKEEIKEVLDRVEMEKLSIFSQHTLKVVK